MGIIGSVVSGSDIHVLLMDDCDVIVLVTRTFNITIGNEHGMMRLDLKVSVRTDNDSSSGVQAPSVAEVMLMQDALGAVGGFEPIGDA